MGHQLSQTFLIQYHLASSGSIARQFAVTMCAENPFSEYTDGCETTIDTRKRIHLGFALQLISLHRRQKIYTKGKTFPNTKAIFAQTGLNILKAKGIESLTSA